MQRNASLQNLCTSAHTVEYGDFRVVAIECAIGMDGRTNTRSMRMSGKAEQLVRTMVKHDPIQGRHKYRWTRVRDGAWEEMTMPPPYKAKENVRAGMDEVSECKH